MVMPLPFLLALVRWTDRWPSEVVTRRPVQRFLADCATVSRIRPGNDWERAQKGNLTVVRRCAGQRRRRLPRGGGAAAGGDRGGPAHHEFRGEQVFRAGRPEPV